MKRELLKAGVAERFREWWSTQMYSNFKHESDIAEAFAAHENRALREQLWQEVERGDQLNLEIITLRSRIAELDKSDAPEKENDR